MKFLNHVFTKHTVSAIAVSITIISLVVYLVSSTQAVGGPNYAPAETLNPATGPGTSYVEFPEDWGLLGTAGTDDTINFIGTTDAMDFVVKTNDTERTRLNSDGSISTTANGITITSSGAYSYTQTPDQNTDYTFQVGGVDGARKYWQTFSGSVDGSLTEEITGPFSSTTGAQTISIIDGNYSFNQSPTANVDHSFVVGGSDGAEGYSRIFLGTSGGSMTETITGPFSSTTGAQTISITDGNYSFTQSPTANVDHSFVVGGSDGAYGYSRIFSGTTNGSLTETISGPFSSTTGAQTISVTSGNYSFTQSTNANVDHSVIVGGSEGAEGYSRVFLGTSGGSMTENISGPFTQTHDDHTITNNGFYSYTQTPGGGTDYDIHIGGAESSDFYWQQWDGATGDMIESISGSYTLNGDYAGGETGTDGMSFFNNGNYRYQGAVGTPTNWDHELGGAEGTYIWQKVWRGASGLLGEFVSSDYLIVVGTGGGVGTEPVDWTGNKFELSTSGVTFTTPYFTIDSLATTPAGVNANKSMVCADDDGGLWLDQDGVFDCD